MSRWSPIDLSLYPVVDAFDALSFEGSLARDKADLTARWNARRALDATLPALDLTLESEPLVALLQTGAYREMLLGARINDRIRSLTLAGATGARLDHIAMTYFNGTARRVVTPADPVEATPAVLEDDDTFRARVALQPESLSTCGPEGGYVFHALSADGDVLDVAAYSEDEGLVLAPQVHLVVASRSGDGTPSAALLAKVLAACSRRDRRPMGDLVVARAATPLPYVIDITLKVASTVAGETIRLAALKAVTSYATGRVRWLDAAETDAGPSWIVGRTIRRDTLAAAAAQPGVVEVIVNAPSTDVNTPAAGYATALPAPGALLTAALDPALTVHLLRAPRPSAITIRVEQASGGWA